MVSPEPVQEVAAYETEFEAEMQRLIRARYPLVYVLSDDERRAERLLRNVARRVNKEIVAWNCLNGLSGDQGADHSEDILVALGSICSVAEKKRAVLYVLKDAHFSLSSGNPKQPQTIRSLRNAIGQLEDTLSSLVILAPRLVLPPEIEKETTIVDVPPPERRELRAILDEIKRDYTNIHVVEEDEESVVTALLGLTEMEAMNALFKAAVDDARIDRNDLDALIREKKQIIRKSGTLEFYQNEADFAHVGGLAVLTSWLREKHRLLEPAAQEAGHRPPRAVLLVGVPGCGKSLTAKAVADEWGLPLLKFDIGSVFGKYVGESEENVRKAIRMAEAVAPCVLWIDEIEKGFSGTRGTGELDAGTTQRVFGTFLTWLSEKKSPVFVVATANAVGTLPAEFTRKGRFDAIFFLDLPTLEERRRIFEIHIHDQQALNASAQCALACCTNGRRRAGYDAGTFDLDALANASEGYSGADIEAIVITAYDAAYIADQRDMTTDDVLRVIGITPPSAANEARQLQELREWAKRYAVKASASKEPQADPTQNASHVRNVELKSDAHA